MHILGRTCAPHYSRPKFIASSFAPLSSLAPRPSSFHHDRRVFSPAWPSSRVPSAFRVRRYTDSKFMLLRLSPPSLYGEPLSLVTLPFSFLSPFLFPFRSYLLLFFLFAPLPRVCLPRSLVRIIPGHGNYRYPGAPQCDSGTSGGRSREYFSVLIYSSAVPTMKISTPDT